MEEEDEELELSSTSLELNDADEDKTGGTGLFCFVSASEACVRGADAAEVSSLLRFVPRSFSSTLSRLRKESALEVPAFKRTLMT